MSSARWLLAIAMVPVLAAGPTTRAAAGRNRPVDAVRPHRRDRRAGPHLRLLLRVLRATRDPGRRPIGRRRPPLARRQLRALRQLLRVVPGRNPREHARPHYRCHAWAAVQLEGIAHRARRPRRSHPLRPAEPTVHRVAALRRRPVRGGRAQSDERRLPRRGGSRARLPLPRANPCHGAHVARCRPHVTHRRPAAVLRRRAGGDPAPVQPRAASSVRSARSRWCRR